MLNDNEKSIKFIRWISLFSSIVALIIFCIRLLLNNVSTPVAVICITIIILLLSLYCYTYKKVVSYTLLSNIFFVTMFIGGLIGIFFAGGLNSPAAVIIPTFILLAFVLYEKRTSYLIAGLISAVIILFMTLEVIGFKFPINELTSQQAVIMKTAWLIYTVLIIGFSFSIFREENERLKGELFNESITDHLTGLPNRRFIEEFVKYEAGRAARNGKHVSVLIIDIDYFKKYNDRYGHVAGDKCLIKVAETLKNHFKRSTDFIGRYGGEEFMLMIAGLTAEEVKDLANGFLKKLELIAIPHEDSEYEIVTVSIGINVFFGEKNFQINDLIDYADKALYLSKAQGRNLVSLHNPEK